MFKKSCILFFLLALGFSKAYAQQFYVTNTAGIQSVNIQNGVATTQKIVSCSDAPNGIAMHGSTFYCLTTFGGAPTIYRGTISGNTITNCVKVAQTIIIPNALTVDNSGVLYYAGGNSLYKIDPGSPNPVFLGSMPYTSGGDLAFYNNDLYMASPTDIVKINLANPSQSTGYISIPTGNLYGLTAVTINNVVQFYAFSVNGNQTDVLALDMANQKVTGVVCTLPYIVYDAASLSEGGTTTVAKNIAIDTAVITQVCNAANQGQVHIMATPDTTTAVLTYTLNNTANKTGVFTGLTPGSYTLDITSTTGVKKDTTIIVPDYSFNKAAVKISATNPVCTVAGNILLTMPNSTLYTVVYNNMNYAADHSFSGFAAGNYTFNIVNQNGCGVDTVSVMLNQDICYPEITFPNTFTPNNDGINDVFAPNKDAVATNYTLTIYSRWGTVLFGSHDVHEGWNGQYKGKPAATGTYYWIASFTDGFGKKNKQSGSATLIR